MLTMSIKPTSKGRGVVKPLYYKHRSRDASVLSERYYIVGNYWGEDMLGRRTQYVVYGNVVAEREPVYTVTMRQWRYWFRPVTQRK